MFEKCFAAGRRGRAQDRLQTQVSPTAKTVGRYLDVARDGGVARSTELTDEIVATVACIVQERPAAAESDEWRVEATQFLSSPADWTRSSFTTRLATRSRTLERRLFAEEQCPAACLCPSRIQTGHTLTPDGHEIPSLIADSVRGTLRSS